MADEGAGATLTFSTSGFSLSLLSIQVTGLTRESLPTFHLGTGATTANGGTNGWKTYIPADFTDPGTVEITWLYDPNQSSTNTSYSMPIPKGAAETMVVTYPVPTGDNNGATESFTGFITDMSAPELAPDSIMTATATIKRSGIVTFTTSSS